MMVLLQPDSQYLPIDMDSQEETKECHVNIIIIIRINVYTSCDTHVPCTVHVGVKHNISCEL